MRISVLGNSDTTGLLLPPGARSWPALLEERLPEALGQPVTVDSWRWAAYRPGAVSYAMEHVEEAEPDLVIVTLASYWCAFPTVQNRVEQRWGKRAARWYRRLETRYAAQLEGPAGATARTSVGRRFTRKLIGASTPLTVEQFLDIFSEVIRRLSQTEIRVLVMGDHHSTREIRAALPDVDPIIARIEQTIRPMLEVRHLLWGDIEEAISVGGDRDSMIGPDGIHMTAAAHQRVADALVPALAIELAPAPEAASHQ